LRVHVFPVFGSSHLGAIRREQVKEFLAGKASGKLARNSVRLILSAMRVIFNAGIEDGVIDRNPAARLGKLTKTEKPAHKAESMTREDAEKFLAASLEVCPDYHPLFLTALRAGLRKGELLALQWGDINFGATADDPRYILVQRNWSHGQFITPKNGKPRRVDLSKELRAVLLALREARLLAAFQIGKESIADELVFPSQAGTVIKPDNIARRYMEPALTAAGLRRFRFHDLRHTFGSLLIQAGASLVYVRDQMGHSSIQITVDCYGHLVPGADIANVDRLDAVKKPATKRNPRATWN